MMIYFSDEKGINWREGAIVCVDVYRLKITNILTCYELIIVTRSLGHKHAPPSNSYRELGALCPCWRPSAASKSK